MALRLPNLDDLTWEQLVEEGRSLIPAYAPEWTNHNVADPGITLIELFAYLSEILVYRLNRVSDNNLREFLKLIHGPEWSRHANDLNHRDLEVERRKVLSDLRQLHRAVTPADFESIAMAINAELTSPSDESVLQARCLPGLNLSEPGIPYEKASAPGHVSVVVLSENRHEPSEELRKKVGEAFEKARLLTTWVHVVGPRYVPIAVRLNVAVLEGADPEGVRSSAIESLTRFFDAHHGGPQEKGWPFGRSIFLSDVYALLARLPGVSFVGRIVNTLTGESFDELEVDHALRARQVRNRRSELEAIALLPNELVKLEIDRCQVMTTRAEAEREKNR